MHKTAKKSAVFQQVTTRLQEIDITVTVRQRLTQITKKIHKRNPALERHKL